MFFKLLGGLFSKLLSGFLAIVSFVIEHWRIFLPLAIVVIGLIKINTLEHKLAASDARHANHLAEDKAAAETRRQENTAKYLKAAAAQEVSNYQHQSEIYILKGQYENKIKTDRAAAVASDSNWRERVRLEVARNAAYGVSGNGSDTSGSAEGKRDCDTTAAGQAYDTLELACAITTSDYNSLRRWADNTCRIYTCK